MNPYEPPPAETLNEDATGQQGDTRTAVAVFATMFGAIALYVVFAVLFMT